MGCAGAPPGPASAAAATGLAAIGFAPCPSSAVAALDPPAESAGVATWLMSTPADCYLLELGEKSAPLLGEGSGPAVPRGGSGSPGAIPRPLCVLRIERAPNPGHEDDPVARSRTRALSAWLGMSESFGRFFTREPS